MFRFGVHAALLLPCFAVASDRPAAKPLADLLAAHPEFAKVIEGEYFAKAPELTGRVLILNATSALIRFEIKRDGWWMPASVASGLAADLTGKELRLKSESSAVQPSTYKVEKNHRYWIDVDKKAKRLVLLELR